MRKGRVRVRCAMGDDLRRGRMSRRRTRLRSRRGWCEKWGQTIWRTKQEVASPQCIDPSLPFGAAGVIEVVEVTARA